MATTPSWVIIGCGYTGVRLARRLVSDGHSVIATRRSIRPVELPGVDARTVDLSQPDSLHSLIPAGAVVVHMAPPAPDAVGEKNLVAAAKGARRIVYVSATSVYPAGDGGWIDEQCPVAPSGARGRARLAAEQVLLSGSVPAVVLRSAGIYGPGRGAHVRIAAGTYQVIGSGDTYVCRIHVDDLVSSIVAAGTVEPLKHNLFNVVDDVPSPSREVADGIAELLGVPRSLSIPVDQVPPATVAMLTANRRVSNRRLVQSLGVQLRYPSWRVGVPAAIAAQQMQ